MWDSTDYGLDWPGELLCEELRRLRANTHRPWSTWEVRTLLDQAFHTPTPGQHFSEQSYGDQWISALLDNQAKLRPYRPPTPYWRDRKRGSPSEPSSGADPRTDIALLWTDLYRDGYFGRDTYEPCPYDPDDDGSPPELRTVLNRRFDDQDGVWPPFPHLLDDDTFYELIEVLHDLAGRPRRVFHHHEDCPGHPHDYDTDSGQRIYRALVNRVLAAGGLGVRLAEEGEDLGRLVEVVDDAREELIVRTLRTPQPRDRDEVGHAVALFRRRHATAEDKRAAIFALGRVLESRKTLLNASLFSKDDDALWQIANKFDLRHRDERQHSDYDPAFRDWVFWWYLATIELTDRIHARQSGNRP